MYYIKLNDDIILSTSNQIVAIINYRYMLHRADFTDNQNKITLLEDNNIIYQHHINTATAQYDFSFDLSANDFLLLLMDIKQLSIDDLKSIVKESELSASNSKISGWLKSSDNRKYQKMYYDELYVMLDKIIAKENFAQIGYTPENLKAMIKKTGLSNAEFSRVFSIPLSTLSSNIANVDTATHRSMSYKTWLELSEKVEKYLTKNIDNTQIA